MAKYIIDTSKCYGCAYNKTEKELEIYFQYLSDIPIRLKNAIPYTEPDRKAIENEVWENTWKMFLTPEDFGATMGDSYSEAKAKYDAWKKEKEDETIKQKVIDLAEEIGIHRLYAIVREIRGE